MKNPFLDILELSANFTNTNFQPILSLLNYHILENKHDMNLLGSYPNSSESKLEDMYDFLDIFFQFGRNKKFSADTLKSFNLSIEYGLDISFTNKSKLLENKKEYITRENFYRLSFQEQEKTKQKIVRDLVSDNITLNSDLTIALFKHMRSQFGDQHLKDKLLNSTWIKSIILNFNINLIDYIFKDLKLSINEKNKSGKTPVMYAKKHEALKYLFDLGADLSATNSNKQDLFFYFNKLANDVSKPMLDFLYNARKGSKDFDLNKSLEVTIFNAIEKSVVQPDILSYITKYTEDINNIKDSAGQNLVEALYGQGRFSLINKLDNKINLNYINENKESLVHLIFKDNRYHVKNDPSGKKRLDLLEKAINNRIYFDKKTNKDKDYRPLVETFLDQISNNKSVLNFIPERDFLAKFGRKLLVPQTNYQYGQHHLKYFAIFEYFNFNNEIPSEKYFYKFIHNFLSKGKDNYIESLHYAIDFFVKKEPKLQEATDNSLIDFFINALANLQNKQKQTALNLFHQFSVSFSLIYKYNIVQKLQNNIFIHKDFVQLKQKLSETIATINKDDDSESKKNALLLDNLLLNLTINDKNSSTIIRALKI